MRLDSWLCLKFDMDDLCHLFTETNDWLIIGRRMLLSAGQHWRAVHLHFSVTEKTIQFSQTKGSVVVIGNTFKCSNMFWWLMWYPVDSLLQMPSAGAHRLSSVSSHDSGFVSQDANMHSKPPSPMPSDITSQVAVSAITLKIILWSGANGGFYSGWLVSATDTSGK